MVAVSIFLLSASFISAKNEKAQNRENSEVRVENNQSDENDVHEIDDLKDEDLEVKNPKAKTLVEDAVDIAQESEATAESSLKEMEGRPGFLKFVVGPDYKNAGQVRSEIVRLRNQISKLTRTREGLSASDRSTVDQTISALQKDMTSIETQLNNALSGFSLFGWLSRLLNGFVAPVAVATPTASASATPVLTASPVATSTPEIPPTAN